MKNVPGTSIWKSTTRTRSDSKVQREERAKLRAWLHEHSAAPFGAAPEWWREKKGAYRDSQRQRIYRSEDCNRQPAGMSLEQCEALARAAIRKAFGLGGSALRFEFHDGRGCVHARGGGGYRFSECAILFRLTLPAWARQPAVVLHEAAHTLVRVVGDVQPAHGRLFAHVQLLLIKAGMGGVAHAKLKAAYKEHGVKHRPRRPITAEESARLAAIMRERMQRAARPPAAGEVAR